MTTNNERTASGGARTRLTGIEKQLDQALVKNAPFQLPKNVKDWLVRYSPWIALAIGVLGLWGAWALWQLSRVANTWIDYANEISRTVGTPTTATRSLGLFWYLALVAMVIQSLMQIAAFPGLRDRKKSGWNWLFYSALLGLLIGVFYLFVDNRGVGSFLGSVIGTVIGLYFLFQIRSYYLGKAVNSKNK